MQLEFLASFVEAARLKSIAKAAEALGYTHTAVSKHVRAVETRFGTRLFRRTPSGVELTEAGERLYRLLLPWLGEWEAICTEMNPFRGTETVPLGALPSLAAYWLPTHVLHLKRQGIQVEVHVRPITRELLELLKSGTIEAAVLDGAQVPSGWWQAPLFTEPCYAIVPHTHPLAGRSAVTTADLAAEPLAVYPAGCDIRRRLEERLQHAGPLQIQVEVPFGEALAGYVAAGAGIAVMPETAALRVRHPGLAAIPLTDPEMSRTVVLVALSAAAGRRLAKQLRTAPSRQGAALPDFVGQPKQLK